MKKLILIIGVIVIPFIASAQKMEKPEIDKIYGDTTFRTKEETVYAKIGLIAHVLSCRAVKMHGKYALMFKMTDGMSMGYIISKDDQANVKLANGTVINLMAASDTQSNLHQSEYGSNTICFALYNIDNNDLEQLNNNNISVIRIVTSKAPFDYELKESKADVIKKELQLITSQK